MQKVDETQSRRSWQTVLFMPPGGDSITQRAALILDLPVQPFEWLDLWQRRPDNCHFLLFGGSQVVARTALNAWSELHLHAKA